MKLNWSDYKCKGFGKRDTGSRHARIGTLYVSVNCRRQNEWAFAHPSNARAFDAPITHKRYRRFPNDWRVEVGDSDPKINVPGLTDLRFRTRADAQMATARYFRPIVQFAVQLVGYRVELLGPADK